MPLIAKMLSYDKIPAGTDPQALKDRARRAWQAARQRGALPEAMVDRLWADGTEAMRLAPPAVRAVMAYRSEVLFALLADRAGWQDREPPAPLQPPLHHGRSSWWGSGKR
jgi:hypothetical protein